MEHQLVQVAKGMTTLQMRQRLKWFIRVLGGIQMPTRGCNIFIFATPRSGSTWLMELILSQPDFRACDQPLDLRNAYVRRHLGIASWIDLYQTGAEERLRLYLQAICDGRIRGLTTIGKHRRLISRKLVFKIQNGWQDRAAWIRGTCGGKVVLLIRHPIAVTVSRAQLPRLQAFVESDYARHFSKDLMRLAKGIIRSGSFYEKGILHWCFENAVPLRATEADWAVVTYEQLVTRPEQVLKYLSIKLDLPDVQRMARNLCAPSRTSSKSTAETQSLLEGRDRNRLISKWRREISDADERAAFEIVKAFGIDVYEAGQDMPADAYLVRASDQCCNHRDASDSNGVPTRERLEQAGALPRWF